MNQPRPRMISARPSETAIEGGEALIDPNGVVGAENDDGGAEPDPGGAAGDGDEHDLGGGDREILAVVLPHGEEVQAELVRELRLGNDIPEDGRWGRRRPSASTVISPKCPGPVRCLVKLGLTVGRSQGSRGVGLDRDVGTSGVEESMWVASTFLASTSSGTLPPSTTASLNAFRSISIPVPSSPSGAAD